MSLIYEIADEYLPDIHVNGMDCPDTESAKEIINKILDAVLTDAKFMAYDDGDLYLGDLISILDKLREES